MAIGSSSRISPMQPRMASTSSAPAHGNGPPMPIQRANCVQGHTYSSPGVPPFQEPDGRSRTMRSRSASQISRSRPLPSSCRPTLRRGLQSPSCKTPVWRRPRISALQERRRSMAWPWSRATWCSLRIRPTPRKTGSTRSRLAPGRPWAECPRRAAPRSMCCRASRTAARRGSSTTVRAGSPPSLLTARS